LNIPQEVSVSKTVKVKLIHTISVGSITTPPFDENGEPVFKELPEHQAKQLIENGSVVLAEQTPARAVAPVEPSDSEELGD
jgi:hypothetical protein